jgi:transposase-like protein
LGRLKGKSLARKTYSPEFREQAVRLVIDSSRPVAHVARELKVHEGTLCNWVNAYRREHASETPAVAGDEQARMRELERQNRELRAENDFLKKAAAYFAKDHR